tara:strand:- start:153 stop:458 length:306 start_codon:yes stop_codon:yes gene_type:complete
MTLHEFIFGEFDGAVRDKKRPNGSDSGIRRRAFSALSWQGGINYDDVDGERIWHSNDAEYRIIKQLPNLMSYKWVGQSVHDFIIQRLHTVFRSFNNEGKEK